MQMLGEMEIDLEGLGPLIFSELVGAPAFGKLTREAFVEGASSAGYEEAQLDEIGSPYTDLDDRAADLASIRQMVEQRESQLAKPSYRPHVKSIYKHSFILARPEGQKAVPLDMAIVFWRLLFNPPSLQWSTASTPWLEWWVEFLESRWKKSVNKDMWDQTFAFAEKTLEDESLSWWSEDSAWPGVIDEFVEYVQKEKRGSEAMDVAQ